MGLGERPDADFELGQNLMGFVLFGPRLAHANERSDERQIVARAVVKLLHQQVAFRDLLAQLAVLLVQGRRRILGAQCVERLGRLLEELGARRQNG